MPQTKLKTRHIVKYILLPGLAFCAASPAALAGDLRITIPRRSELTPVQRLNREGVDAVRHHNYEKAEALFYKAYLYDPSDPFTLNNLGYISELQGQLDRAETFYKLASEQGCNAEIDRTSAPELKGKPMMDALGSLSDLPMRVNRLNIQAIEMLSRGEGFEAQDVLEESLKLDPQNPFTLEDLGVAYEATGDFVEALRYYDAAAATGSKEPIVITLNRKWRGQPLSQAAQESAAALRKRMSHMEMTVEQARMLSLRGVAEANQNNWDQARQDFLEAYRLDPSSAFTLNNRGYLAEKQGDLETAQFYYSQARKAGDAADRVGLATNAAMEGQHLGVVARSSNEQVDGELNSYTNQRRGQPGPIELIPRSNESTNPGTSEQPGQPTGSPVPPQHQEMQ